MVVLLLLQALEAAAVLLLVQQQGCQPVLLALEVVVVLRRLQLFMGYRTWRCPPGLPCGRVRGWPAWQACRAAAPSWRCCAWRAHAG